MVGALMDTVAAIIIIAPVIVPMGIELGLDPLHLGMIFVINLVIGYVTPVSYTHLRKVRLDHLLSKEAG